MKHIIQTCKLGEIEMVFTNSFLSLCIMSPLFLFGDLFEGVQLLFFESELNFVFLVFISGACAFLLSMSTFWAVGSTSPTTVSMVGALNKIPLTFLGWFLFGASLSTPGVCGIFVGLSAGVLYAYGKNQANMKRKKIERFLQTRPNEHKV